MRGLAVLFALLARVRSKKVWHNVTKACVHQEETAPTCQNDATLFAYEQGHVANNDVQRDNCATCVCSQATNDQWLALNNVSRGASDVYEPSWGHCCAGWNGTACDVCQSLDACPALTEGNQTLAATNCTAGEVVPSGEELAQGKRFSCVPCGPGFDDDTPGGEYCGYIDLPAASLDVTAFEDRARIEWHVGIYRNDNNHFPKQNFYDYAEFFDGDL
eukprot:CAMPEP_0119292380 /NCGR_PEP_ID=MMETSP1329-20130426/44071_1 /TAXON_ID=114041 /ORGANISM="Genus nov. species nov., Strain RCC1024" /LENGTH=216 /DNA_ID=CAMNT_0007293221 /DNA_START=130 /DNA_END=777 /DNA_ORIENTATION=-